jgi:hypothetical protein
MPKVTTGASRLVDMLVKEVDRPGADNAQIAAAARAMVAGAETPVDQAWLHIVAARTLPGDELIEAINHAQSAYEIAESNGPTIVLVVAGLVLYAKLVEAGRNDEAHSVLRELGSLALENAGDKLGELASTATDVIGSVALRAGLQLSRWSTRLAASKPSTKSAAEPNNKD